MNEVQTVAFHWHHAAVARLYFAVGRNIRDGDVANRKQIEVGKRG